MLLKDRKIGGHPRKEPVTPREVGLGAVQGQSLVKPAQSPGFHSKHHKKREKEKSVTAKAAILLQMYEWPWVTPSHR